MPVYLSSQSFSALSVFGGWLVFVVLLLGAAIYATHVKGQVKR